MDFREPKRYERFDAKDDSVGIGHQTINKKKSDLITVISSGSFLKILNANDLRNGMLN